jgi:hypothetical protein
MVKALCEKIEAVLKQIDDEKGLQLAFAIGALCTLVTLLLEELDDRDDI